MADPHTTAFPRCATCKHWERDEPYSRELGVKRCMRVPEWWEATEWNEEGDRVWKPEMESTFAFANDGSSYAATFLTRAEFGCVMHEVQNV